MSPIKFYFLQASRSIQIAWLLEELGLEYDLEIFDREPSGLAPDGFKQRCGTLQGKAPVLKDGDLTIMESGAICDYLCEKYDESGRLLPISPAPRAKVREWVHPAEGTFLLHGLVPLYVRRVSPSTANEFHNDLTDNVAKDLDWLEAELDKGEGRFLVGQHLTVADIMMHFSVQFIFAAHLIPKGKRWQGVGSWLQNVESEPGYQRAVERTGYNLG